MKEIQFIQARGKFSVVSIILVLASLGWLFTQGMKRSVDFEGGSKLTTAFMSKHTIGDLRTKVEAIETGVSIVEIKKDADEGSEFTIKIRKSDEVVGEGEEEGGGLSISRQLRLQDTFASMGGDDAELLDVLKNVDQAALSAKLLEANVLNISDVDAVKVSEHEALAAAIKGAVGSQTTVRGVAEAAAADNPERVIVGINAIFPAINRTTTDLMTEILNREDPLGRGDDADYSDVVTKIEDARSQSGDFLKSLDEAATAAGEPALADYFKANFTLGQYKIVANESFSASIAAELLAKAWYAVILALLGILLYIAMRFQWGYAVSSVVALTHDVIIALGVFAMLGGELSNPVVAAFLTIVGYSLNDTIVVFDRIRDNIHQTKRPDLASLINKSINQTLSRTVVTSITTFFVVGVIFVFSNNETLEQFSLPLIIGIIVGTYSSIFVASPTVLLWHEKIKKIVD